MRNYFKYIYIRVIRAHLSFVKQLKKGVREKKSLFITTYLYAKKYHTFMNSHALSLPVACLNVKLSCFYCMKEFWLCLLMLKGFVKMSVY